jgi:hypothetical protein
MIKTVKDLVSKIDYGMTIKLLNKNNETLFTAQSGGIFYIKEEFLDREIFDFEIYDNCVWITLREE